MTQSGSLFTTPCAMHTLSKSQFLERTFPDFGVSENIASKMVRFLFALLVAMLTIAFQTLFETSVDKLLGWSAAVLKWLM